MNHRNTKETVLIRSGIYSTTIYEMEVWTLADNPDFTDEEFKEQLENYGWMNCGLCRDSVGLFPTKESALEHLDMMYDDPYDNNRELYCAFIREKAMHCMMQPNDYIKEWTYVKGHIIDESLVRNYAEDENPFFGRPKEMVRFQRGDIVMIPDGYSGHWGIVWDTPISSEYIKETNDRIERETGARGDKYSGMDWTDDQYTILTDNEGSHEHILAHYVLRASHVPEYVRKTLEEGLRATVRYVITEEQDVTSPNSDIFRKNRITSHPSG